MSKGAPGVASLEYVLYGDWFFVIGRFVGTELQTSPFVEAALMPSLR
jgi:hypothetical protein